MLNDNAVKTEDCVIWTNSAWGKIFFSSSKRLDPLWGPKYPPIQWVQGLLPGTKWSWVGLNSRLAHRLRIRGAIPPIPLYAFFAWRVTTLPVPLYYTDCPQSFTQSNS